MWEVQERNGHCEVRTGQRPNPSRKVMVMFSIIEPKYEGELTKYRRRSVCGTPKIPVGYDHYSLSINPRA